MDVTRQFKQAIQKVRNWLFPANVRWYGWNSTSTALDYERLAGEVGDNGVVSACVQWICRVFSEAPPRMYRELPAGEEAVVSHDLLDLLRRPNPYYSGSLLWWATVGSWLVDGNAYWLKVRDNGGRVVGLYYYPHTLIRPEWPKDGSELISHYVATPNGQEFRIEREDIVHMRYGMDAQDMRRGLSPLKAVLREIATDNEAATYSASLMRNMGVPGVLVVPDKGTPALRPEARAELKAAMMDSFTGDRRGEPMVMSHAIEVQEVTWSPEKLSLDTMRTFPETRICAAIGLSPMVVGLKSGLDRSTFSNYEEARQAAYESTIMPAKALLAEELETQLLPDFTNDEAMRIGWDYSNVRVLQDDETELYRRMALAVKSGIVTVNEARRELGMPDSADPSASLLLAPVARPQGELEARAYPYRPGSMMDRLTTGNGHGPETKKDPPTFACDDCTWRGSRDGLRTHECTARSETR